MDETFETEEIYETEEAEPRSCLRQVWVIARNALALVAVVLIASWLYNAVTDRLAPPEATPAGGPETVSDIASRAAILERVQRVNKQVLVQHYNAVDVRYTEAPEGFLGSLGVRQEFVMLIRGHVPAGLDLQQLSVDDLWISSDGRRVQLTLPPPEVFRDQVSIDFENSYILSQRDTCPGFICRDDLEAYQSEIMPTGRDLLVEYGLRNGILEQAARDGRSYYEQLLSALGFEEVRVIVTGYDD
ncbi:MAG: DUF4230 domain-containing protein [Anaerolineaceae bacterium]|nr:DUF4230 domain-containing protein [Anaerolineaceae bacterium]